MKTSLVSKGKAINKPHPFPSKAEILAFIKENPAEANKRGIARAFGLDAEGKAQLRGLLKDLKEEGEVKSRKRALKIPGQMPEVAVLAIDKTDMDGELLASPLNWPEDDALPPKIYIIQGKGSAVGIGDRVLARLKSVKPGIYDAKVIKRLEAAPTRILGVYKNGRLIPTDRRAKDEYSVSGIDDAGARPGELVWAETKPGRGARGVKQAKIVEKLGVGLSAQSISLIAIQSQSIPWQFPQAALDKAKAAGPVTELGEREDLRQIPLVTIDGCDARDFDDAVFAREEGDGFHIIVAIADVAHYVRPGDALDKEALNRGNSVYFPDRVVPMLPEELSNGWCSLKPNEDRPVMAAHLWIDKAGDLKRHKFVRGLMRSSARLTYNQVQLAYDNQAPELVNIINPLYAAFKVLEAARKERGALEIDAPEAKVILDAEGSVAAIQSRERFDSHKLIEEMMILANIAAAETLEAQHYPCMYRIHAPPPLDKVEALREFLPSLNIKLTRSKDILPLHFNQVLAKVKGTPHETLVNELVLRSQSQAVYGPENIGHFGLALARYAHFTSPIRRYADLLVHRALISALGLGEGGLGKGEGTKFQGLGEMISLCERRAVAAEREAMSRYSSLWLAQNIGKFFTGRVSGVTRYGLFIRLPESGAEGILPMSLLPSDFYHHDEDRHCLIGKRSKRTYKLGQEIRVRLKDASEITGSITFEPG